MQQQEQLQLKLQRNNMKDNNTAHQQQPTSAKRTVEASAMIVCMDTYSQHAHTQMVGCVLSDSTDTHTKTQHTHKHTHTEHE
eukprot:10633457-Alexandrium_andersonii.AAC.1